MLQSTMLEMPTTWVWGCLSVAILILLVGATALSTELRKNRSAPLYRNDLNGLVQRSKSQIPTEIFVETSWGESCCDAGASPVTYSQNDSLGRTLPDGAFLLQDFMTHDECARIIRAAESHGFGSTQYPKAYRGNERLTTTDHSLASAMWARVEPFVPQRLTLDGSEWEPVGLNETWRLSKYSPGDDFKIHLDGKYLRDQNEQSMFTVNAYLNADFSGGSTRFYNAERDHIVGSIKPATGLCLIFRQPPGARLAHDGEEVASGVKYLVRSDVMYRRVNLI
jgi:prolyl 4-hydroxylase